MSENELMQRIEQLENQVKLLESEIIAIKNIGISENARQEIEKMERANKIAALIQGVSGESIIREEDKTTLDKLKDAANQSRMKAEKSLKEIESFLSDQDAYTNESLFEYKVVGDGVEIKKYIGMSQNEIVIPQKIGGQNVVSIGDGAFRNCKELNNIILPTELLRIGNEAFIGCEIEEIYIPNHVITIGESAFRDNDRLRKVVMGNSVREICDCAFDNCRQLEDVSLSESLKNIDRYAFRGCYILSNIVLPRQLKELGEGAFDATNIKKIVISESTVKVGAIGVKHIAFLNSNIHFVGFWNRKYTFYCMPGSTALDFARENYITVKPLSEFNDI